MMIIMVLGLLAIPRVVAIAQCYDELTPSDGAVELVTGRLDAVNLPTCLGESDGPVNGVSRQDCVGSRLVALMTRAGADGAPAVCVAHKLVAP